MTAAAFRLSDLPDWPRWMSREIAASYVGVSPNLFDKEVANGWWPRPEMRGVKGAKPTWDRALLDRRSDERSGLAVGAPANANAGHPFWGKSA